MHVPPAWPVDLVSLARRTAVLVRAGFLATHPEAFLLEEGPTVGARSPFDTIPVGIALARLDETAMPPRMHPVEKRPGANAFTLMVTVGRAPNNDVVIARDEVSKFHASLAAGPAGWSITDASTNGTWVDGERLAPRAPRLLRPRSVIALARHVRLVFLGAEQVWEELERIRRPTAASA